MGAMRYALRSDDITTALSWSIDVGTEQTQYEAAHIGTDVIARPAKAEETIAAWLADATARPGGKQRVDAAAVLMHNLTAGLSNVRIQGNATDDFTTPTFDHAFTVPAYRGDGFPIGFWLDLTGLANYTASGFEYWRLSVGTANANPVAVKVKLLRQLQTLDPNISWGAVEGEDRGLVEHRTDHKVSSIYDLGVTVRSIAGDLDSPDTQKAAIRTLWQSTAGRVYPFLLIPDGDVNDAWFVRFLDPKLSVQLNLPDRNSMRVGFEELSRGLVL